MINKKLSLLAAGLQAHFLVLAQNTNVVQLAKNEGFMRSEAKIYVVMAVTVTILTGLIIFVWRLDRKISKLEKKELVN